MLTHEETLSVMLRPPLTASGTADPAPTQVGAGYGMPPTGELAQGGARVPASPPRDDRKPATRRAPETRAAQRVAWGKARAAAAALVQAIEDEDPQARFIAADDLDQALGRMWAVRADRDSYWKMIINHAQGMLRQLFNEKLVEALTRVQGAAIRGIVENHLGPATRSKEDLSEVTRLISDAGCDPYYAISGDPAKQEG